MALALAGAAWLTAAAAAETASGADPTRPASAMADRMKARLADDSSLRIHALVVGASGAGVALVGETPASAATVRAGSALSRTVDGVSVDIAIRTVSARGVEIATDASAAPLFLAGGYSPLPPPANAPTEFLNYLECEKVPVGTLLRLVSDQTGVNIASSDATAGKTASIFLRNVTADAAVEEICRATGLWYRRDNASQVIRVTTMDEYSDNLNTFREESTEMFTLLYPNVVEVAGVIYGLYPDRTFLSLGEEEIEDDGENDLARRFERFRVLEDNGGSQFLDMEPPQTSTSGGRSGGSTFSFSRGSALSRITQWDRLRQRETGEGLPGVRGMAQDDARMLELAYRAGDTNLLDLVRSRTSPTAANIFVTLSRKNNVLVVRTSDVRIMDEIRAVVKQLDVPTPMVLMEVKVLELDVTDDYDAGVKWTLLDKNSGSDNGLATHALGHDGGNPANVLSQVLSGGRATIDPTFSFAVISDYLKAEIEMMQKDGKVRTLATPTLLVANNEVSRIFSGKEYPLVTGWTKSETTATESGIISTPATAEIERKDVGTMLLITPNINADRTVTLRLLQENSEIAPEKVMIPVEGGTGESKAIEYVESRQITGTFVAKDDMMVMAGGLVKEHDEVTYWRTPVLGSTPLIGWLFRGTEKVKRRTELVVLIKPHVITTPMEGGRISKELMRALSAHPAADGRDSMGVFKPDEDHGVRDDVRNAVGK